MAEEKQCMCTTPEITIKLNKQGPQGKVGPQGEPGFSPYVGVANDTPSQYILRITNEDGEYLTPNLKANIPLGGNTGEVLTKNSDVNGDCSFKALPYATTSQQGVVYLATTEEALLGDPDYAITGEVLLGVLSNMVGNGTITLTQGGVTKGIFTTNQASNTSIALENTTYTAGKNIVITGTSIATSSNPIFGRAISFTDRNNNEYEVLSLEGLYPNTYIKVGMSNQELQLFSGTSTITTRRSGNDYINIDSGNISSYLPDIPTVGNGTITFTQGGVTKGTITTNQSGDATIAFDAGGSQYVLPPATTSTLGGVIPDGTTITVDANGTIHGASTYVLPTASTSTLGGVKVDGTTITIDNNGVISSSGGSAPSNMVTTDTAQTITGRKTFESFFVRDVARVTTLNGGMIDARTSVNGSILDLYTADTSRHARIEVAGTGSSSIFVLEAPYPSSEFKLNYGANATTVTIEGTNINTVRNNQTYANIDSGNIETYALTSSNISTNAYIQALEARIAALEANINGGNA